MSCAVCPSNTCTDCSSTHILDVAGMRVSVCPATEYGVVDTDLQCSSCSDASCDFCASSPCTDCSSSYILDVAGTCVSACPATEYGGVALTGKAHLAATRAATSARPTPAPTAAASASWTWRDARLWVPRDRVRRRGHIPVVRILQRRELRRLRARHVHRLQQHIHLRHAGDVCLCGPFDRVPRRGH